MHDYSTSTLVCTDIVSIECLKIEKGSCIQLSHVELCKNLFQLLLQVWNILIQTWTQTMYVANLHVSECSYVLMYLGNNCVHAVVEGQISALSLFVQVASLGYDFADDDSNPFPVELSGQREDHGTSCAGEIAMVKNNGVCGVGVAYQSSITGGWMREWDEHNLQCYQMTVISWQGFAYLEKDLQQTFKRQWL